MISVLSATRRPQDFEKMICDTENKIGSVVSEYIAFVNTSQNDMEFKRLQEKYDKLYVIFAPDYFIFRYGFDTVYNLLSSSAKSKWLLLLFDSDVINVQLDKFTEFLQRDDLDLVSYQMYMQRGDAWETKYQLYRNDFGLKWFGLVHENQVVDKEPRLFNLDKDVFNVQHLNAKDEKSKDIKKTDDGIIILEPTQLGDDGDMRNVLYESLSWKIVNANGRHNHKQWFVRHYEVNKDVIDEYYRRGMELWG